MSKIYLYSNIILLILALAALTFSILDIIIKDNFESVTGCPKSNCSIEAKSISAKNSTFNRIKVKDENTNISINDINELTLGNTRCETLKATNANISTFLNNININDPIIPDTQSIEILTNITFNSNIECKNLTTSDISVSNGGFINKINSDSIKGSKIISENLNTTDLNASNITSTVFKVKDANLIDATFTKYKVNNTVFKNLSFSVLKNTNITTSNIINTKILNTNNLIINSVTCTNMNNKSGNQFFNITSSLFSFTKSIFPNITATQILFDNINIYSFSNVQNLSFTDMNCKSSLDVVNGSSNALLTSTGVNVTNSIYKKENYNSSNELDIINNLNCDKVITKDALEVDTLELPVTTEIFYCNELLYSLNINKSLNAPLRGVNGINLVDLSITYEKNKLYTLHYNNNKSPLYNEYFIPTGDGYNEKYINNINLSFTSINNDIINPDLYSGLILYFTVATDLAGKTADQSCQLYIYNEIDYTIDVYGYEIVYNKNTSLYQSITKGEKPTPFVIYKFTDIPYNITLKLTCTYVDKINKKLIFFILPI